MRDAEANREAGGSSMVGGLVVGFGPWRLVKEVASSVEGEGLPRCDLGLSVGIRGICTSLGTRVSLDWRDYVVCSFLCEVE